MKYDSTIYTKADIADHRVHTEWQSPISGVHSIMMEKSALAGEGGGCTPTPHPPESIATLAPCIRSPIEGHKFFSRFPANESLRRTGLHLSLSKKSSFYLPAFEISRPCRLCLPSRTKLQCTLQLRGQIHSHFISTLYFTLIYRCTKISA
jgi:hypothetical protein